MNTVRLVKAKLTTENLILNYRDADRFLPLCKTCGNYGANYACPPLTYNPQEHLLRYGFAHIMGVVADIPKGATMDDMYAVQASEKRKLDAALIKYERAHPGTSVLSSGSCTLCEVCARKTKEPCRHKEAVRPSFDAYSVDLTGMAKDLLGVELKWAKGGPPEYIVMIAAVLSDSDECDFGL